jgi:hypothetical protein
LSTRAKISAQSPRVTNSGTRLWPSRRDRAERGCAACARRRTRARRRATNRFRRTTRRAVLLQRATRPER